VRDKAIKLGPMSPLRLVALTTLAMLAFAGNSLLCRAALKVTSGAQANIDAASFTTIRLIAGAVVLWLLVRVRTPASTPAPHLGAGKTEGNWLSAVALFAYAICFSYAYVRLPAATGALLLFGAVQATMIGVGIYKGERLRTLQLGGLVLALSGLVGLLVPDHAALVAPPLYSATLMLTAGMAWGIYSLRGKGTAVAVGDATRITAGNFARAALFAIAFSTAFSMLQINATTLEPVGIMYALLSGAITSGVGYAIWYSALPALKATTAATVQLSVPVIATFGGVLFLQEAVTWRMVLASIAILGGIALVIFKKQQSTAVK
jgi:drug/metabolite transporter (DMT)-like permease